MPGLQIGFGQDIIILLVVTILIGALLSAGVGYVSDLYFGDLVGSLVGGTGDQDVMLIIKENKAEAARKKIEKIIADKLPGAEVDSGVKILGRVNFFIELPARYQVRSIFLELDNYFQQVPGLESFSLITEPRITIRGLKSRVRTRLASKINNFSGVKFTLPAGDKLEVIIEPTTDLSKVRERIEKLLADYQVLSVRFPINNRPDNLFALAEQLTAVLTQDVSYSIYNVTAAGRQNLENLVDTMVEMKNFLQSYASHVKVKLKPGIKLNQEDKLVVPGTHQQQIILRVEQVSNQTAAALITSGDSRKLIGNQAYKLKAGQLGKAVGEIEVYNPRQQLAYTINQITTVLPVFQTSLQEGQLVIKELKKSTELFKQLRTVTTQLKVANRQLTVYQQELDNIEVVKLQKTVAELDNKLTQVAEIVRQLQFIRDLLLNLTTQLNQAVEELSVISQRLALNSPYRQEVSRLEAELKQLVVNLEQNTKPIINYLNQYNPVLQELINWQQELDKVNKVLNKAGAVNNKQFKTLLNKVTNQQLITKLEELNTGSLGNNLNRLETRLQMLAQLDIETITEELNYIQQSLPQLKDEEITDSIDLIDEYIAGRVIPGEEISLLLSSEGDIDQLEPTIQSFFSQPVSISQSQPGLISPSYRSQIYQILGEVRMILAALTAVIWTVFSLLFDQITIISSLKLLIIRENRNWALVLGNLYGAGVGAFLLSSIFQLAQIKLPYIPFYLVPLVGIGFGLIAASKAEQLSGVSADEFEVGKAVGFNYAEIMQQIIIPSSKPGLLQLLNQTKSYF